MANEVRLIDADALLAEIQRIRKAYKKVTTFTAHNVIACIKIAPTVDAVEVVRCKDCKHLKYGYQCYYPLGMMLNNDGDAYVLVDPDEDFCSRGERREGE